MVWSDEPVTSQEDQLLGGGLTGCFAFWAGGIEVLLELEQLILQHLHLLTLTVQAVPEFKI